MKKQMIPSNLIINQHVLMQGWSEIFLYIYNNLKKFICLPFKKNFGNTLNFFYGNKIKSYSIICSTFSGWMIVWFGTFKEM